MDPQPPAPHVNGPAGLEDEVARAVRHAVAATLQAGDDAARDWGALLARALDAGLAAGGAGMALAGQLRGVARGVIAGVQDAQGDLDQAAHEIVHTALQQAHQARLDVARVAQEALHGIAQGAADAGADPTPSVRAAVHGTLRTAAGLGVIAAETVELMLAEAFGALVPPPQPPAQAGPPSAA